MERRREAGERERKGKRDGKRVYISELSVASFQHK